MNPKIPILVGTVLILGTASMTYFVLQTSKDQFDDDNTYEVYADFTDASGIRWKTRVQISGIDVGKIEGITHEYVDMEVEIDGKRRIEKRLVARVKLRILNDYTLYQNARISKVAESLLGDFRLNLIPGSPEYERIEPGGIIPNVQSVSDLEEIQSQLRRVSSNVNAITESLSNVLAGPEGEGSLKAILGSVERSMEAIERTTRIISGAVEENDEVINALIRDVGTFAETLARYSSPGGEFQQIARNLADISQKLSDIVGGDNALEERAGTLESTMASLDDTLSRLASITEKIDEGDGTVGKLVNDPSIADKVETTLDDTNKLLGGISRLQTEIELRSEYGVPFNEGNQQVQSAIKNTLSLRLWPRPDKYYILEAISDPRGKSQRRIITTTSGNNTTTVEENVISFNDLKFSAQFAKRYYWATFRFGIIENTGGLGFNLHALEDDVEVRFDAFDFDRRDPNDATAIRPRLRGYAMYELFNHLWVQAGLDDPLNDDLFTWFGGGVLRFTDEDLRSLLVVAPSP